MEPMEPNQLADALMKGEPIHECSPWSEAWREILRQHSEPACFEYFKRVVECMIAKERKKWEESRKDCSTSNPERNTE